MDVPDGFYNADQWVDRLSSFEQKKAGLDTKKKTDFTEEDWDKLADTFLDEEDFLSIRQTILHAHLLDMLKQVVDKRQTNAAPTENSYECILKNEQLEQLLAQGKVTLNLITDLQKGSNRDVKFKISDIILEVFEIESDDKGLSVSIEFVHSGVSVLLEHDGLYYKFVKAPSDSPICWGFVYNHADYLRLTEANEDPWTYTGESPLKKDKLIGQSDLNFIGERFGDSIEYQEYAPAFSSDITLWLDRGKSGDKDAYLNFLASIKDIIKVQFTVTFVKSGTLPPLPN